MRALRHVPIEGRTDDLGRAFVAGDTDLLLRFRRSRRSARRGQPPIALASGAAAAMPPGSAAKAWKRTVALGWVHGRLAAKSMAPEGFVLDQLLVARVGDAPCEPPEDVNALLDAAKQEGKSKLRCLHSVYICRSSGMTRILQ